MWQQFVMNYDLLLPIALTAAVLTISSSKRTGPAISRISPFEHRQALPLMDVQLHVALINALFLFVCLLIPNVYVNAKTLYPFTWLF